MSGAGAGADARTGPQPRAAESVAVIGAGHNGLVCALLLARAGFAVTLLEAADEVGGCVWTDTDSRGLRRERGAIDHGGVHALAEDLGLAEHGLRFRERDTLAVFRVAGEDRRFAVSAEETASALGSDGPAYLDLAERAASLFGMIDRFPEPPTLTQLATVLARLRGGDELFRSLLAPARAVIEQAVTDPRTRAALELYASHSQIPSWAPGSGAMAMMLPSGHGHAAVRPEGGSAALTGSLRRAFEAAGGTVRTGAAVREVRMAGAGGGTGAHPIVVLDSGESLEAGRVVSTIGVPRTAALLERAGSAPAALRLDAASQRSGQFNVSELTVSITRASSAPLLDDDAIHFVQSGLGDLHRGFGDLIAGRLPASPWAMVADVPQDEGVTGSAVWLSSVVPIERADGPWTSEREQQAGAAVIEAVSRQLDRDVAPEGSEVVVTGPLGWAERIGGIGNPNHVDLTLDQLFGWRPASGRGARTEAPWLYLAGAGVHPGGGLSGASGRAAAEAVIADARGGARGNGAGGVRGVLAGAAGRVRSTVSGAADEAAGLVAAARSYRAMRKGSKR
ncbi:NAD(P)/FAD-dependent oxidoreductase [Herbiconiux moechotypicola]|uniref:Pyridine nucleotide-disulfide oxidoreductase domain-containing protein 2 n=1 Tax=Herbiconiux moechotypicola TaxID=637393 RepID=A0ABP5QG70_9MICO|nr:NAD(P)/FAD-dependent oxidoreductase [Herbiconiux moechotypicola]MCS5730074.1 NAD(P)/FAD-dependent oxidoreductase [Herbiconiux moechotypicola]